MSAPQQYPFVSDWVDRPPTAVPESSATTPDYQRRALLIWPGLDRSRLRRAHGDPWRIARLVAGRTTLPVETILTLLMGVREARAMGRGGLAGS